MGMRVGRLRRGSKDRSASEWVQVSGCEWIVVSVGRRTDLLPFVGRAKHALRDDAGCAMSGWENKDVEMGYCGC